MGRDGGGNTGAGPDTDVVNSSGTERPEGADPKSRDGKVGVRPQFMTQRGLVSFLSGVVLGRLTLRVGDRPYVGGSLRLTDRTTVCRVGSGSIDLSSLLGTRTREVQQDLRVRRETRVPRLR